MGLFGNLFGKKEAAVEEPELNVAADDIVAMADGHLIDVSGVSDPVFAQKMMGESVAFRYDGDKVTVCAPASGELTACFPTGHAFGITMADGVEVLVHIGIDTVNANGDGFRLRGKKQGDKVKAGDAIVDVDLKKLGAKYDMSTMLIITNPNGKIMRFVAPQDVKRGQSVIIKG